MRTGPQAKVWQTCIPCFCVTSVLLCADVVCKDHFSWCYLVPQHGVCNHKFYGKQCCKSCSHTNPWELLETFDFWALDGAEPCPRTEHKDFIKDLFVWRMTRPIPARLSVCRSLQEMTSLTKPSGGVSARVRGLLLLCFTERIGFTLPPDIG